MDFSLSTDVSWCRKIFDLKFSSLYDDLGRGCPCEFEINNLMISEAHQIQLSSVKDPLRVRIPPKGVKKLKMDFLWVVQEWYS